jgi:hypothetical protein
MKVIVLVTSSDDQSIYAKHREVWKKYMNKHPDVETYFIQSSEEYSETTLVGDTLWMPGKEGYPTNLERIIGGARVDKTVSALRWLFEHKQFDYVVRTGLSAVWIYRNLIPFLQTLPTQGVYCGTDGGGFVSGAGMILSPDVCKILVDKKDPYQNGEEDCVISSYLQYCGVVITPYTGRIGYSSLNECKHHLHAASPNAFQFRIKTSCIDEKRGEEPEMMMCILKHYNVC